ncbi:MEDS domain-containing protein [Natrarchaeobius oligotrophus]|uniref:Histidine kinase n=1 Tax=Natrarchaeobius chitinivorans TaxID=1679083 RepID=A0A3N6PMM8_NATCH|nr:MEDS domain-containing protein [Natrarchaeobius chitinivorans]RQH00286.1 histidine kinase [Natrarchaeobius chitinivorans]
MDSGERGRERERTQGRTSAASRTPAVLRSEFATADLCRHLALFYEFRDVQLTSAAAFVDHGLRTGHRCLYLVDDTDREEIESALRRAGVDVDDRIDAGDLVVRDATDVYLESGFDPDRMVQTVTDACHESVSEGYEGLFVAGENTWCFRAEGSFDHVLEFEASFDAACPELPVVALCQYDLSRFSGRSAAKALWTHEQVVYRNTICENPYYVPPEEYRSDASPESNARLLLAQTHDLTRNRRLVEEREQRLSVVNRVLRHNIRNDLNTIIGTLGLLAESDRLGSDEREHLEVATEYTERVVQMAEKARYVQRTVENPTVEPTDLESVVERAVNHVEEAYPDARVTVTNRPRGTVLADTNLDVALVEALTNAVIHQDDEPPSATLTASESADVIELEVSNPGPPIPEPDRRALRQGHETPLEHGSGLGLWLVKWVVENGHGTLSFPEEETCILRLELLRASTRERDEENPKP